MKKSIPVSLIQQAAIKKGVAYLKACMNKGKIVGSNLELSLQDYNEIKKDSSANKPVEQPVKQEAQPVKQEAQPVKQEAQPVKQEAQPVAAGQNNSPAGAATPVQKQQ